MRVSSQLGLLGLLCACAFASGGCAEGADSLAPSARRAAAGPRFDVDRAWRLTRAQVRVGQRPAGSPQLRRLASRLRARLPHGRFEAVPGEPGLRNVVGHLPGRRPGILVGAHYDTLVKPRGFVGANNGAAGTAMVVEVARALNRARRPADAREVTFVLFDGEEPAVGLPEESDDFYSTGLRGSRAWVKAHPHRVNDMLLLDYVANRGIRLPREASSTRSLWRSVRSAARDSGAAKLFPNRTGAGVIDDHSPFLRAGVRAVDLIDWSYAGHSLGDRLDKLSRRSMRLVGQTVALTVARLR